MSTRADPLQGAQTRDRVAYAMGVLLDADAFGAEQTYHRGRLARALAYLHGSGTVAGLRVEWQGAIAPGAGNPGREERLVVHPGMAVDRLGRMIEVPRDACIRLQNWYLNQSDSDLIQGLHGPPVEVVGANPLPDPVTLAGADQTLKVRVDADPQDQAITFPAAGTIPRSTIVNTVNQHLGGAYARLTDSGDAGDTQAGKAGGVPDQLVIGTYQVGTRLGAAASITVRANPSLGFATDATATGSAGLANISVIVDVFLRFVVCEQGKTNSFLSDPFDALGGVTASRLEDSYELALVIRKEESPSLPRNPWPDLSQGGDAKSRLAALHDAIFNAWHETGGNGELPPLPEHAAGQDITAMFLARLRIPTTSLTVGARPQKDPNGTVAVDNDKRSFVYTTPALARWVGVP